MAVQNPPHFKLRVLDFLLIFSLTKRLSFPERKKITQSNSDKRHQKTVRRKISPTRERERERERAQQLLGLRPNPPTSVDLRRQAPQRGCGGTNMTCARTLIVSAISFQYFYSTICVGEKPIIFYNFIVV